MDGVASDIIKMLAEKLGLSPAKIGPSSRLVEDLGMDVFDAEDFFILLEKTYGTDLSALHERWSDHFCEEGSSNWDPTVIMPAAIIGGLAYGTFDLGVGVAIAITVALLALWMSIVNNGAPPDKIRSISVAQVVEAVEAGTWPSLD